MSGEKNQDSLDMSDLTTSLLPNSATLTPKDKAGLVSALKDKLQNLQDKHTDVLEALTPKVRKRVEVLREIQDFVRDGSYNQQEIDEVRENLASYIMYNWM